MYHPLACEFVIDAAKGDLHTSSQDTIIVRSNDQKTGDIDSIPIQVYPQTQGISLVTSSGILTADISTFSTQVPAILTEGDADDTEAAVSFAEQFHVVTTSSVLAGSSQIQGQTPSNEMLSVMMSSGDFTKGVILTPDQQQALLGEMIAPGVGHGQTLHIAIPHVATGARPLVSSSLSEGTGESQSMQSENQVNEVFFCRVGNVVMKTKQILCEWEEIRTVFCSSHTYTLGLDETHKNNCKPFQCHSMPYCVRAASQCCKFPTHMKSALILLIN
jgi:hypothetical protein